MASLGSPPLAWGILSIDYLPDGRIRITPTCVGNTSRPVTVVLPFKDHPHLRGEY